MERGRRAGLLRQNDLYCRLWELQQEALTAARSSGVSGAMPRHARTFLKRIE